MNIESLIQVPDKVELIDTKLSLSEIIDKCAAECSSFRSSYGVSSNYDSWYSISRINDNLEEFAKKLSLYFKISKVSLCHAGYTAILHYNDIPTVPGIKTSSGGDMFVSMILKNSDCSQRANFYLGRVKYKTGLDFYNNLRNCDKLRAEYFKDYKAKMVSKFILDCKEAIKEGLNDWINRRRDKPRRFSS